MKKQTFKYFYVNLDNCQICIYPKSFLSDILVIQYCQTRSVNILTRVCRELTRLSRSKHTLVNILTIGQLEHPQMTLDDPPFLDHRKLKLACRNMIVKKKIKKINLLKSYGLFSDFLSILVKTLVNILNRVCRELTRPEKWLFKILTRVSNILTRAYKGKQKISHNFLTFFLWFQNVGSFKDVLFHLQSEY